MLAVFDIMFPWAGLYENYNAHLICSENIHKLKTDILLSASKVHECENNISCMEYLIIGRMNGTVTETRTFLVLVSFEFETFTCWPRWWLYMWPTLKIKGLLWFLKQKWLVLSIDNAGNYMWKLFDIKDSRQQAKYAWQFFIDKCVKYFQEQASFLLDYHYYH